MPEGRVQRVSSQAPPFASCRSHSHPPGAATTLGHAAKHLALLRDVP